MSGSISRRPASLILLVGTTLPSRALQAQEASVDFSNREQGVPMKKEEEKRCRATKTPPSWIRIRRGPVV